MTALDDARRVTQASSSFPTSSFSNAIMSGEALGAFLAALVVIGEELHTANLIAYGESVLGDSTIEARLGWPHA